MNMDRWVSELVAKHLLHGGFYTFIFFLSLFKIFNFTFGEKCYSLFVLNSFGGGLYERMYIVAAEAGIKVTSSKT